MPIRFVFIGQMFYISLEQRIRPKLLCTHSNPLAEPTMHAQKITDLLNPVLQQYPDYQLKPITYVFGNSRVELEGPADAPPALHASVVQLLRQGGFEAYPVTQHTSALALNVRAKQL
jgi:hypothetical protein